MVDVVNLHLVHYLLRVRQRLGDVGEDGVHLLGRLEPLLLGVVHAVHIVHVVVRAEADKPVVCLGVLLFHKVRVVGADNLHPVFFCQVNQYGVHLFLPLIHLLVAAGFVGLVALQLDIVILTEHRLEPLYRLFRARYITRHNLLWQFTTQACRRTDNTFVELLQQVFVNTARVVEGVRHKTRAHNLA